MDQAHKFEEAVVPSRFTLFFDCPEDVMEKRLLKRGETSGRSDDNAESIKKRFKTFVETSMPVVNYFKDEKKVEWVMATKSPEEVYEDVKKALNTRFAGDKAHA
jgi:UMP-CMP kinase